MTRPATTTIATDPCCGTTEAVQRAGASGNPATKSDTLAASAICCGPTTAAPGTEDPDGIRSQVRARYADAAIRISSIPTLMAFRDGVLVFSQPGALPSAALEEVIASVRELDMDEVRSRVAGQRSADAAAQSRSCPLWTATVTH